MVKGYTKNMLDAVSEYTKSNFTDNVGTVFINDTGKVINRVVVLLNKDNNVLLNPATGMLMIADDDTTAQWDTFISNGDYHEIPTSERVKTEIYRTDISGLAPNTKYKMYVENSKPFTIADWNGLFFKSGTTGVIPAGGTWLDFETNDNITFGHDKFKAMFRMPKHSSNCINNATIFAVPVDKYNANLRIENTSGGVLPIDITLNPHDLIVYKDGRFCKRIAHNANGDSFLEPVYEPLPTRANNILTCVSYIKNNNTGYDVNFYNENGDKLSFTNNFGFVKFNYIQTKDRDFIHNDYRYPLMVMNIGHGVEVKGRFLPNSFLDIISMGYNTVQMDIRYNFLYEDDGTLKAIGYQNYFDRIDFAIACGLRVILKFYGWTKKENANGTWESSAFVNKMKSFEMMIIDKYKNNPSVIGYSIANEPTNAKLNLNNTTLKNRYESFVREIQTYIHENTNQIIFVELVNGADFTLPNIAYEYHYYTPHLLTHHCMDVFPNDNIIWRDTISPKGFNTVYSGDTVK